MVDDIWLERLFPCSTSVCLCFLNYFAHIYETRGLSSDLSDVK